MPGRAGADLQPDAFAVGAPCRAVPARRGTTGLGLNLGIRESCFKHTFTPEVRLCNTPQMLILTPRGTAHCGCYAAQQDLQALTVSQPAHLNRLEIHRLQRFSFPACWNASLPAGRPAERGTGACGKPRLYSLTSGSPGCPNVRRSASGFVGPCSQALSIQVTAYALKLSREVLLGQTHP